MEYWYGFLGPGDHWEGAPIFHCVPEAFAAEYAAAHTDTLVWEV